MTVPSATPGGVRFAVVSAAWNCEAWVGRCLRSIQAQEYRRFRCVLVDDCSPDRTFEVAKAAVAGDDRFEIVRSEQRSFPLANIVRATARAATDANDVVVIVDGDDWLKHARVFDVLARVYSDPAVWLTYGSHELFRKPLLKRLLRKPVRGDTARPYPAPAEELGMYRYMDFRANHLRTYRKFLFDAIRDQDLRGDDGRYWESAGDLATMVPMLEMATSAHSRFLPQLLYVYNNNHPWSELRPETGMAKLRVKLKIAAMPRYAPLQRG